MEWWQIFGILFLFFSGMYVFTAITKEMNKNQQKEKLALMVKPHGNAEWQHPEEVARSGGGSSSGSITSANGQSMQRIVDSEDASESIVTRLPKALNHRFNLRQTKKNLEVQVEIGKLQVEHITNANEYADQFFDLQSKSRAHRVKDLDLDRQIMEKENELKDVEEIDYLRDLNKKNNRLDLDISIAEKEARLSGIKNPPQAPVQPSREEIRAKNLKDTEAQIEKLEVERKQLKNNSQMPEDARQARLNQIGNKLFELYEKRLDLL
jgi:hypothetical protein